MSHDSNADQPLTERDEYGRVLTPCEHNGGNNYRETCAYCPPRRRYGWQARLDEWKPEADADAMEAEATKADWAITSTDWAR